MMENFEKIDIDMDDLVEAPYNGEPLSKKIFAVETEEGANRTNRSQKDFPRLSGAQRRKLKKEQKMAEGTWMPNKPSAFTQKTIPGFRRSIAPEYSHSRKTIRGGSGRRVLGGDREDAMGDAGRSSSGRGGRTLAIINYQYPRASSGTSTFRPEVTYKKTVNYGIRMAVIHKLHPDITLNRAQGDLIEAKLEQLIDGLPIGGPSPQFNSTRFEGGAFWLTCANESTKDWLAETIAGLESLWDGGVLMAVLEKDLPKRQKVLVWIPGSAAEEDAVRARLVVQNPSLNTDGWQPLSRKVVEKGQAISFSIDEGSFEALKKLEFRPFWGLGRGALQAWTYISPILVGTYMMENKNFEWKEKNVLERKYSKGPRTDSTRGVEKRNMAGREILLESAYPGVKGQMWRDASLEGIGSEMPAGVLWAETYARQYGSNDLKRTYTDVKNSWEQPNPKRSRSRGSESSQAISYNPRPKSKRHAEPIEVVNYKEGHTKIKMAIINRKHPDLVVRRGESELIQAEIERIIDGIPAGGVSPQFQGTRYEAGVLWVTCANTESKDWLVKTIDRLEPMWEGGALRAVGANNIPMRTNVLVWIPGSSAEEDVVRTRLKVQNPTLMTEDWQPLSRKVVEKGQTLAFSIDHESFNVLKELDFMPYLGLSRVTFTNLAKKSHR